MSQYPPNPNNNPYGQNPPDPNYNQGTAYGGPPSGQGQSPNPYNPYPTSPSAPGTGPNQFPNNPSLPGTNPNPYGPYGQNPPTPAPPPNPGYTPYDPYAQTVASTNPSANYNQYGTLPSAPPIPPPTQPRRGPSMRVILIAVIALVLVVGGIAFGFVSYNNTQQSNANATATARANANASATARANANATATAAANATATAIATNFPFSANQVLSDPLGDNSKGNGWETSNLCKFQGNAYHVLDTQANTFNSCSALNTDFKDFTFQVEAVLNTGDGIGITFRGNANKGQFYRIDIASDGTYGIYVYVDNTGSNARTLTTGSLSSTPTLGNTNFIAIVARGTTMTFYFNQTEVTSFTDSTYSHGQIGMEVLNLTHSADAVFTNIQVWGL